MEDKKRIKDKERILGYLLRKGSVCNTYKVARELGMERFGVLDILNELAKEDKIKLMHGSVKAVTRELSEEEKIKTKSEVEELKERINKLGKTGTKIEELNGRVEELEKWIGAVFTHLKEAIHIGHQAISRKNKPPAISRRNKPEENVHLIKEYIKI